MDTEPSEWSEACDIWLNPLPDIYHLLVLIYLQSMSNILFQKLKANMEKGKFANIEFVIVEAFCTSKRT